MILHAPAKINLYLKVLNQRHDGYHNIISLMQMVGLYDTLTFQEESAHIRLVVKGSDVPSDQSNLVLRAARMLQKEMEKTHRIKQGATITLEKRIPISAGLGGGSSDAACTLMGLNRLWSLRLSRQYLTRLGGYVGSDVPFFFHGPFAWVFGRGERVQKTASAVSGFIVLVFSGEPVSTAKVFHEIGNEIDLTKREHAISIKSEAVPSVEKILLHPENDLEKVTLKAQPGLIKVKQLLESFGGCGALMSGSGPTVFARFLNESAAESAALKIRGEGFERVFVAPLLLRAPRGFGVNKDCFSDSV
ncbi:MAG: 4-(cytidine 5'-diphospho)-2-C-methyl-D-erythritol kinase [Nitrospirota bacterium]